MKESVTYQAIVDEGRLEEARQTLLELGSEQLGQPSEDIEQAIGQITDLDRLHQLRRRLRNVGSWKELLAAS
jgi:hypothetical protein